MSNVRNYAEETCLIKTASTSQSAHGSSEKGQHQPKSDVSPNVESEKSSHPQPKNVESVDEESANGRGSDSSEDEEEDDFPEGGLRAWLVVFGSFCAMFMVFGIVNSTAAFQDYLASNQLRDFSSGEIGWIFSVNLFLVFFCGIYVGNIFDAYGHRVLVAVGSVALILSMMLLGFCTSAFPPKLIALNLILIDDQNTGTSCSTMQSSEVLVAHF